MINWLWRILQKRQRGEAATGFLEKMVIAVVALLGVSLVLTMLTSTLTQMSLDDVMARLNLAGYSAYGDASGNYIITGNLNTGGNAIVAGNLDVGGNFDLNGLTVSSDGTQVLVGGEYLSIPREGNVFIHKNAAGTLYTTYNGTQIVSQSSDPAVALRYAMDSMNTNWKLTTNANAFYLDEPLVIRGKLGGIPSSSDNRGFYECIVDFGNTEFVYNGADTNIDFITLESSVGTVFKFGPVTSSTNLTTGKSLIKISPTIQTAFAGSPDAMFSLNNVWVQNAVSPLTSTALSINGTSIVRFNNIVIDGIDVSGAGLGVGVYGGSDVYHNKIEVGSLSTASGTGIRVDTTTNLVYENNFTVKKITSKTGVLMADPQPASCLNNKFHIGTIDASEANGIGIDLQGGAITESIFCVDSIDSTGGTAGINSPYADGNIFYLQNTISDANEAIIFGASSVSNLVIAGKTLATCGYDGGSTTNKFVYPGVSSSGTATMLAGTGSIGVAHGLAKTPTRASATMTSNPGIATSTYVTYNSANVTISVSTNVTNQTTFDWRAVIGEGN